MTSFGKLLDYTADNGRVVVRFESGSAVLSAAADNCIHVRVPSGQPERVSRALLPGVDRSVELTVRPAPDGLSVSAGRLIAVVHDHCLIDYCDTNGNIISQEYSPESNSAAGLTPEAERLLRLEGHSVGERQERRPVAMVRGLADSESLYGLGDKTGFLDKRGYEYDMWNTDNPAPQVECFRALYKSVPLLLSLSDSGAYGVFCDNTFRSTYDLGKRRADRWSWSAEGGELDYWFILGDGLGEVVAGYTALTGRSPLPQLWTLGYHQSRWSYMDEAEIAALADTLRSCDIPCDAIHFDIDYMDGYRVFTWDRTRHPDPRAELDRLAERGFKAVTIIDPGVKLDPGYRVYDEGEARGCFARDAATGATYVNEVWPGDAVYPDFGRAEVREWWGGLHSVLTDAGVRGVWDDMNEPASFRGELPADVVFYDEDRPSTHAEQHNVYGHNMARATYEGLERLDERRPFVITRACYAGSQRWAVVWTGDNHSLWTHLQMAIPQLCNLGMSGFALTGTDVGGFSSDCTPELLARWVQVGCFSTLFRNHSAAGTRRQEPWLFGSRTLDIYRRFVKLRYRLIPLYYDLLHECQRNGLAPMRPLVLNYPGDRNTRNMNDQFMLGSSILVSPVVTPGAEKKLCYLPQGVWYDYLTGERLDGGWVVRDAPLESCPIFARAGAIIPVWPEQSHVGQLDTGRILTVELFGGTGEHEHRLDDGETRRSAREGYSVYRLSADDSNGRQTLSVKLTTPGERRYERVRVLYRGKEYEKELSPQGGAFMELD